MIQQDQETIIKRMILKTISLLFVCGTIAFTRCDGLVRGYSFQRYSVVVLHSTLLVQFSWCSALV